MDMSADFLACLCRAKDAYDGNLGLFGQIFGAGVIAEVRVIPGRCRLVEVDTVQPNLEGFHVDPGGALTTVQTVSLGCIAHMENVTSLDKVL